MSFSSEVKKELSALYGKQIHCQAAELAGLLSGLGCIRQKGGQFQVSLTAENRQTIQKYTKLLEQAAGIFAVVTQAPHTQQKNKQAYVAEITDPQDTVRLLALLKYIDDTGELCTGGIPSKELFLRTCCKRAFLRGAFLATGSMSNPKKSYHFEIVCTGRSQAEQIQGQFCCFGLEAKIVTRKGHEIVYLKEGAQIVDALNIMGAHTALMDLENVRIIKEMRNDINRRVNCEAANINKTVHAAYRQQEAIRFLQEGGYLKELPQPLKEIAQLRIEYPQAPIKELGTFCSPPVGKSGVNHRLRKLEELAVQKGYQQPKSCKKG